MAMNEVQLPTKDDFYRVIRNAANQVESNGVRWTDLSNALAALTVEDLNAMGVPTTGTLRTDLAAVRTSLANIVTAIQAESAVFSKFRNLSII